MSLGYCMDRLHRRHHTGSLAHHHRQGRCHRSIMIIDHASCIMHHASPLFVLFVARSSYKYVLRTVYRTSVLPVDTWDSSAFHTLKKLPVVEREYLSKFGFVGFDFDVVPTINSYKPLQQPTTQKSGTRESEKVEYTTCYVPVNATTAIHHLVIKRNRGVDSTCDIHVDRFSENHYSLTF